MIPESGLDIAARRNVRNIRLTLLLGVRHRYHFNIHMAEVAEPTQEQLLRAKVIRYFEEYRNF